MTSETRWWHIRHAPVPDPHGRIYGSTDVSADVSDTDAFAALADVLPEGAVWVVSSLRRTRQTAEKLCAVRPSLAGPAAFVVEPDLREQDLGDWHGRPRAEVYAEIPERHPFWIAPAISRPPGGESFLDLMARVHPVLQRLGDTYRGRDVVCVTHGGTIRAAMGLALSVDPETALRFVSDNLGLTRLDLLHADRGVRWRVVSANRVFAPYARHG